MPFRLTKHMLAILLLALALAVTGCDGDDDEDNGEPVSAATSAEISTAMEDVFDAVGDAMGAIQTASTPSDISARQDAQATVDATFACDDSGEVALNANSTFDEPTGDLTYDATLAFDGCDGITGTLTFDGDGTITEDEVSFEVTLDGMIETDTCNLTMDAFRQAMSFVNTGSSQTFSISVGGRITGGCGEESFTCSFDGVDIDLESADAETETYDKHCRLNS